MSDTLRGVSYMLLATFLFAWMTVFVKLLDGIPVLEIILFRSLISVAMCLWGLKQAGVPVFGTHKGLLMLRGFAGALSLTLNFWLVQEIPLATASTLTYLAPIFTTLLGVWLLKESLRPIQLLFFLLSFLGIVVIQGFDPRIAPLHLGVGIFTSLLMGVAYNCVRKLSGSEHALVIIFYFPLMTLPLAGGWSLLNWVQPQGWQWLYLLLCGISAQLAQYFMTRSYQLAEIGTVSIVNYAGIFFVIVLGALLFGEYFNLPTYLGMALVLSGVCLNVLFKLKQGPFAAR